MSSLDDLEQASRVSAPLRIEPRLVREAVLRIMALAQDAKGTLAAGVTDSTGRQLEEIGDFELTPGSVLSEYIANAAITTAKFAQGIRPVEIVDVLPAPGEQGRVVFLTADNQLYRDTGSSWTAVVPAVNISGQLIAQQIADAAITVAKFAQGIRPVEVVSSLPPHGDPGRIVYLTSDHQLYRDTGTSWTAELAADQIVGQLTAGQIAAGAIGAEQIAAEAIHATHLSAGSVTADALAALSVSTLALQADAVTADKIAAGTITANELAANSVTFGKVAAGAIHAAQVAAGEINGTHIAALSITATHLAVDSITANKIKAGEVITEKLAIGAVTADRTDIDQLSDVAANAGTITAGLLRDSTNTRGIRLGTLSRPGTWTTYLDLSPASDSDYVMRLADDRLRLTRGGVLSIRGSLNVEPLSSLVVGGATQFDAYINSRGGAQFAELGAEFNEAGAKRVEMDTAGSLLLHVWPDGTEGLPVIIGDYVVSQTTQTPKSTDDWDPSTSQASTPDQHEWVAASTPTEIVIPSGDLPSYDGLAHLSGNLRAQVITGGSAESEVSARVRAIVNGNDKGVIATVSANGASGDTNIDWMATVPIGTGFLSVTIQLLAEVYVEDPFGFPGGRAVVDVTGENVRWNKTTGVVTPRRGLFLGAYDGEPHMHMKPTTGPTSTARARGDVWYDDTSDTIKYYDGTTTRTVTAT